MGENKGKGGGQSNAAPVAANRPTITVPARPSLEGFFKGQVSPGPMTLVSSFFAENHPEECRSFSQLLAGVMASPNAAVFGRPPEVATIEGGLSYKQCRTFGHSLLSPPSPFVINSMGLSPTAFLDSPVFASQGPFGISHQQALAHVTAQAVHSQAQKQLQAEYASAQPQVALPLAAHPVMPTINTAPIQLVPANNIAQNLNQRIQIAPAVADKPESDGYNWRKYGQKHVKGTDHPRSYYKCTHPTCPVKKKVECTLDGLVMEIIYKGQHNHEQPQPSKRAKDGSCEMNGNLNIERKPKMETQVHGGNTRRGDENVLGHLMIKKDETMAHELSSVSSEDDELGDDAGIRVHDENDDQHDSKRRNIDSNKTRTALHKTIAEPRVVVQTRSEVDLLDDGYRWRKYGQKVVKGNPHPRSYYKCTFVGCNVRKHVERASTDPTEVVTTYEGKHHHDLPASRSSSHHTAIPGPKPVNDQVLQKPATLKMLHSREGGLQNATKSTSLLPKEEQNTVSCSQLMSSR